MSPAAAYSIIEAEPQPIVRRPRARLNVLLASLAGAVAVTGLTGAALVYAFTHIPEVDPNAEPAPLAAVAAIAAEAPAVPGKLEVLTPPVYGPDLVSEAPAAAFPAPNGVPLSAKVSVDAVDMNALAQADGAPPPCADPCTAQAGYVVPDSEVETAPPAAAERETDQDGDNDGNAPPPPDMTVN